jgi:Haem-NO-binding
MKGIVFNLLEQVVSRDHGEDSWDDLLDEAGLVGAYTSLGSYPDEHLGRLINAASTALHLPVQDVVRWFGRQALPALADANPGFFTAHTNTRSFLLTLNNIIHPEVRKLYPGADVPEFDFDESSDGTLKMGYSSHRKLCAFAEGLIEGAAERFGEQVSIAQPTCMLRGDDRCELVIAFGPGPPIPADDHP